MAKSLRAKSKQANRRKKRNDEDSHYKAVEASRLKAVSDRLLGKDKAGEGEGSGTAEVPEGEEAIETEETMGEGKSIFLLTLATAPPSPWRCLPGLRTRCTRGGHADSVAPKKISTSGPRQNRRQEWRESKGMDPKPKKAGQNKQGKPNASRKAGRNKRRR
jgi:hypothetical protein